MPARPFQRCQPCVHPHSAGSAPQAPENARAESSKAAHLPGKARPIGCIQSASTYHETTSHKKNQFFQKPQAFPFCRIDIIAQDYSGTWYIHNEPTNAGDVVTLIFTNTVTRKTMTFQLIDKQMNNDWKIRKAWY